MNEQQDQIKINVENPTKLDMLYMQKMTLQEQARRIQAESLVNQNGMQQIEVQIKDATQGGEEEPVNKVIEAPKIPGGVNQPES